MLTLLIKNARLKLLVLIFSVSITSSFSANAQQILQDYIADGFKNNIVLQQKDISLEKAQYALKTAKSLFLPTVAFQGGYQTADGGRNIPLPLGDLLNPVYTTLNQLTSSSKFPMLENQSIDFLPKNFYDAKVRTTVPIINSDLIYNKRIAEQQVSLQEFEVLIYKRDLAKNIKVAYYNYLSSLQAIEIYKSSLLVANEGLRVNEKLVESGKGLPAYVLRSKSEVESVKSQILSAEQQAANAKLYFNFLINRDADEKIEADFSNFSNSISTGNLFQLAANQREELKALEQLVSITQSASKMSKLFAVPKLSAFLDLGSQSENFKFNSNTRYYMLGLQLDIPIFSGNRNQIKISQSNLDLKNANLNVELTAQKLALAVQTAKNNLLAVFETYQSSVKQLEAASSYQRLIDRGYKAGSNSFLETVDARNQFSSAQLLVNINRYKVLVAAAELERETANYPIN